MAKLASARETIARLMRGKVVAPAAVDYRCIEPKTEREFVKGHELIRVSYSNRKDYIGLQLVAYAGPGITRMVVVDKYDDDTKAVVFITDYKNNGRTWRVLRIPNADTICSLSSTIYNFLKEGAKCVRLRRLHVGSSPQRLPHAGAGLSVRRATTVSSSPATNGTTCTSRTKPARTAKSEVTPPIVLKKAKSRSVVGPSTRIELPSRSRSTGVLHLSSSITN